MTIAELGGGARVIVILQACFISKEYLVLIDFLKLAGFGSMLP